MSAYSSFVNPMDVYTSVVMAAIRRSISFALLILGSFAALSGCQRDFPWEGSWRGTRTMAIRSGTGPSLENSIRRVTLTIKSNGEYELSASGVPSTGIFKSSGKTATLEPVTTFGQAAEDRQPVKIKANDDGTITMESPDTLDGSPILLRRESQPTESNVRKQ